MKKAQPTRRLRNFLIIPGDQIPYVWRLVAVALALTAGVGWMIYRISDEVARVVNLGAEPGDLAAQVVRESFAKSQRELLLGLCAFAIVLSLFLAAWQIVM